MNDEEILNTEEVAEVPKEKKAPAKKVAKKAVTKKAEAATATKPKAAKRELSEAQRSHGKRYADLVDGLEKLESYEIAEAVEALKSTSNVKFDASCELHIRLGVDPRHQDQQVRGTAALPAGSGKSVRVAVITTPEKQKEAREAGAEKVGEDDLIKEIEGGVMDFDVVVASPEVMGKVGRLGKVLGTKGLMPNPKSGTVTPDVGKAVKEIKAGRVEFRLDRAAIIHAPFGKVSFTREDLAQNLKALLSEIMHAKPSGAKGTYVRSMYVTTTMGPSFRLDQKVLSHLND